MSESSSYKCCGGCVFYNGLAHGYCKNKKGSLSVRISDPICQNYEPKYRCKDCEAYYIKNGQEICGADGGSTTAKSGFCTYFREKPKPTVFEHITESVETLADRFVYYIEGEHSPFGRRWKSTLTGDVYYVNRSSALEATIRG